MVHVERADAERRLLDWVMKAGPGTHAAGAVPSARDVWMVLDGLFQARGELADLQEAYDEIVDEHGRCM